MSRSFIRVRSVKIESEDEDLHEAGQVEREWNCARKEPVNVASCCRPINSSCPCLQFAWFALSDDSMRPIALLMVVSPSQIRALDAPPWIDAEKIFSTPVFAPATLRSMQSRESTNSLPRTFEDGKARSLVASICAASSMLCFFALHAFSLLSSSRSNPLRDGIFCFSLGSVLAR